MILCLFIISLFYIYSIMIYKPTQPTFTSCVVKHRTWKFPVPSPDSGQPVWYVKIRELGQVKFGYQFDDFIILAGGFPIYGWLFPIYGKIKFMFQSTNQIIIIFPLLLVYTRLTTISLFWWSGSPKWPSVVTSSLCGPRGSETIKKRAADHVPKELGSNGRSLDPCSGNVVELFVRML
jgi:hypothetical protein